MRTSVNYLMFLLICIFMSPLIVNADCDYQRISDLKKIASNVQFNYSYDLNSVQRQTLNGINTVNEPSFSVDISNITGDIYVIDNIDNVFNSDTTLSYDSINRIEYDIYSRDVNCPDKLLSTKYITIPRFNDYSLSNECKQYPNFKYCSLWQDSDAIYSDDFDSELALYKKNISSKSKVNKESSGIKMNWYYVIVPVILVLFILGFAFIKRRRK